MTIETIFRTNFYQNGVSEFAVKHIEDYTSSPTSVSKTILCYYVISYKTSFWDYMYIGTF